MKKSDLKKVLKPIVKECIQEALIEEGLLSGVIAEVVKGLSVGQQPIVEQKQSTEERNRLANEEIQRRKTKINETRKQMLDAIGQSAYNGVNIFEGTDALSSAGTPDAPAATQGPLSGIAPGDAGVDISGLLGNGNKRIWNSLLEGKK